MKRALTTAVLAVGALLVIVGGATAQAAEYRSESTQQTYLSGSQLGTNVITFNAGTAKCKQVTYSNISNAWSGQATASLTVSPSMHECTAFGLKVNISTDGCYYRFNQPSAYGAEWRATTDILCNPEKAIRLTYPAANCEVTIPAQSLAGHTSFSVSGAGSTRMYNLRFSLTGLSYQSTGGFCGTSGQTGTLTGEAFIKGFSNEALTTQTGIYIL